MPLLPVIQARAVNDALTGPYPRLTLVRTGFRVLRAARSAREDRRCPQMKDTNDRPGVVRALASVPAWKVPVVAMATPVDPSRSAIERDRLAHIAFVTSVNRTNDGKTAQEARDVTQADEDAYEADSGVEEDAVSETEG